MRINLINIYDEAFDMLKIWRNRYSQNEYPYKIAVNIFYRQYTMDSIWGCDLENSFNEFRDVEMDIFNSYAILETVYSNASQKFIVGDKLVNLMNKTEDIGGLNYKDILPLVLKAQNGDNAAIEELEFSYIFYFLCNKSILLWAAFGRKGFSKIEALAQTTGIVINSSQTFTYASLFGMVGQLGCAETMNSFYSPLPNYFN